MIKDFWQERKEEKKRLKELKKQNKKLPATKEQKAYKVFGIFFTLFIIFGSLFRTCVGESGFENYSWDNLVGLTDEMKIELEQSVNKKDLLFDKQIDVVDWSYCKDLLVMSGIDGVVVDDEINSLLLYDKNINITSPLILNSRTLGALTQKMIQGSVYSDDVELVEVMLSLDDDKLILKSLIRVNLTAVVIADALPSVYVTTTSTVQILNKQMYALNSNCRINDLEESENCELIELINKNSFSKLEFYTNELIARQINDFAKGVNAKVRINNTNIEIY